jgi:DNA-binding GntR family transcriptional regulator
MRGYAKVEISKAEQAVSVIQNLIEEGQLKPGSMVSERGLMEATGFGRTPVREAIQRLALHRMLRIHASKGIEIPAISIEDQLSGLEVRRAMEVLVVSLACERATSLEIDAITALSGTLNDNSTLRAYAGTVRQTHALIIEAAHNPYLEAFMTPLQALSRRFWIMHVSDEKREIARVGQLHRNMLSAISERKVAQASEASLALNDYLLQFTLAVVEKRVGKSRKQ